MGRTLRTWTIAVLIGLTGAACGDHSGTEAVRHRLGVAPPSSPEGTVEAAAGDAAGATVPSIAGNAAEPASDTAGAAGPDARPKAGDRPAQAASESRPRAGAPASVTSGGSRVAPGNTTSTAPAAGDAHGSSPSMPGSPAAGNRTGVTDQEIVFGMHLPQSGPVGILLGKAWHGADAYFRSINDAGGIHGRKVRLIIADDGYSAQKAAGAIRELVDTKKVFAASCLAGVDQCVVGLEYANAKGVPYIHAGMQEAVVEHVPWAFPVTASYAYASGRLVDYLFTKRGYTKARKIGVLHLNSINFDEATDRFEQRLAAYGSKVMVKSPVEKDQSDFSAAITKMQNAGVDTVWYAVDPTLMAKFASQAKLLRFQPQYVFFLTGGDLYAETSGGNLDGAYGLAIVADPDWNGPAMAGFRQTFSRSYPDDKPDEFSILAWVEAQAFVEGVRRAGPDLGRDGFARAMAAIDLLDTGMSSPLSYTKRSRPAAANSALAVWEIHGTRTDQVTGFDF